MPLMVTAREKFWRGVDALASGTGSIQQRLAKAGNHIAGMHVRGDLPDELQSKYDELIASLTRVQSLGGSLKATAESMSEAEASRYASQIVRIYGEINYRLGSRSGTINTEAEFAEIAELPIEGEGDN